MSNENIQISGSSRNFREEYKRLMLSINEQRKEEGLMNVGGTHFKKEREKMSSSNYTLPKILNECVDNVLIPNCNNVNFKCKLTPKGYLQSFSISDDYIYGFVDIKKEGTDNPFNFTHMREGHGNDLETSQFGTGFKGAAVSSCDLLNVFTNVDGKFYKVTCDFNKMASEEIAVFSFDPDICEISKDEYKRNHPYNTGSTLVFEYVKKNVYNKTTMDKIYCEISDRLSECYTDIINNSDFNIYVNDRVVMPEKDYSEEPQCKPFNKHMKIIKYIDEEDDTNEEYICEDDEKKYYRFNKDSQNWNLIKTKKDLIMFGLESGKKIKSKNEQYDINWVVDRSVSYSDTENECIRFKGIFMMYHPDLNTESELLNVSRYPKGRARIYRRGRCHGDWDNEKTNGSSNFTDVRIDYKSKKIGTDLGITWNKDISDEQTNDLCLAVKGLNKKIRSELSGDTASDQNKNLYNIALQNKINVPEKRRPTGVKQPIIVKPQPKPEPEPVDPKLQPGYLPKPIIAHDPKPIINDNPKPIIADVPKPIIADDPKPIIADDPKPIIADVPKPIIADDPKPIIAHEPKPNIAHEPKPIIADDPNPIIHDDPNPIIHDDPNPIIKKITESFQTTITIKEGKKILNKLKDHKNVSEFMDDINKIILSYCDRCAPDQITMALKYMTISKKFEFLDEMIFLKYRFSNDDNTEILGGSKLNTIFGNLEKK
jgi:hypothetical protein